MLLSRLITGLAFLALGIVFIILAIKSSLFMLIPSAISIGVGLYLLINKTEDKIEKRGDLKEKEYKK